MISINATLILQIIHFLILLFILNRIMFRPIQKLIREREAYREDTKKLILDLEEETERFRQELIEKQKEARIQATTERVELKEKGVAEAEKVMIASRSQGAALRAEADEEANQEIEKAAPFVGKEAARLADEVMQRVIGRRITT